MASRIGKNISVSIFGQSHSAGIGCVVEGIPAGKSIDIEALQRFLTRRAPGGYPWSTPRKEADAPEFLSGVVNGVTCGAPLCAVIRNTNTRSGDYETLKTVPRPGHADYVAQVKFGGAQDVAGGGHFSGRLTAPLCVAGGIAKQLLEQEGIFIGAHVSRIAGVADDAFPLQGVSKELLETVSAKTFPVVNDVAGQAMIERIDAARQAEDSVGGVVECACIGLPAGIGSPMFDGLENAIANLCFGVPAVKGVEFGAGFAAADMLGSQHNDPYRVEDGRIVLESNNAGGILGGISTGEPVVFRAAFKPTSSIAQRQDSVNMQTLENEDLRIVGRHDPCVVVRAVPVIEAVCALAVYDLLLEGRLDA